MRTALDTLIDVLSRAASDNRPLAREEVKEMLSLALQAREDLGEVLNKLYAKP